MKAYHNDESIKQKALAKIATHKEADQLVKGKYWENGKGCAVGCLIESCDHAEYEEKFGIPQMLARLEDCIFEGLPNNKAMEWPERFLGAINVGADLSRIGWQFLYWNLTENLVLKDSDDPDVQQAIKQCGEAICPLTKGEQVNTSAAESAESAAWSAESAAWSAGSAAWSAAWERMADKLEELLEQAI